MRRVRSKPTRGIVAVAALALVAMLQPAQAQDDTVPDEPPQIFLEQAPSSGRVVDPDARRPLDLDERERDPYELEDELRDRYEERSREAPYDDIGEWWMYLDRAPDATPSGSDRVLRELRR